MDGSRPRSCLGLPPREEGSDRPHHKAAAKLSHSLRHIASTPSPSSSIQGGPSQATLNRILDPPKTDECVPSPPALIHTPKPYDPSQTRYHALDAPNPYNPPPPTLKTPQSPSWEPSWEPSWPLRAPSSSFYIERPRKQGNPTEPQANPPASDSPEPGYF